MKVRLPLMIKDVMHSEWLGVDYTESWFAYGDYFLDGPVTPQVASIDFDADGSVRPGVKFIPPSGKKVVGEYAVPMAPKERALVLDPDFMRVCVVSAVLHTMDMFQEEDALGRPVTWAFDAPQLLVVPRAGQWENAFYERESRSLQFFYFPSAVQPEETIYSCLSSDIVTHETGHAILDGIAPDLYHAVSPQALALHEAVADLVAVVMAFRSGKLARAVLDQNNGSIEDSTAFAGIAEQFRSAMAGFNQRHFLRNLRNNKSLDPNLPAADPNRVRRDEPHALSEVLNGALYTIMMAIYQQRWDKLVSDELNRLRAAGTPADAAREDKLRFSRSGKALALAVDQFKRLVFRALDYLPPGEVSFADYGRAILAADQAAHPEVGALRQRLIEEFVHRHMASAAELRIETNVRVPAVEALDLDRLIESDWAAYEFANANRELLGIPPGIHFRVRPRLHTTKAIYRGARTRAEDTRVHECLFKVSWDHKEPSGVAGLPGERQITVGTTLVIDCDCRLVRAKLTSDHVSAEQQADRDALLKRLTDTGVLHLGKAALGPDGKTLCTVVAAEVLDGLMRVRGTARTLHLCGEEC